MNFHQSASDVGVGLVIFFMGRSGSTYLVELLNSHPEIEIKKEIFNLIAKGNQAERHKNLTSRKDALQLYKSVMAAKKKVSGFKFKYPLQIEYYPEIFLKIALDKNIKIIHLVRSNVLDAAISRQNLDRLLLSGAGTHITDNKDRLTPFDLNIDKAIQFMGFRMRLMEEYRSVLYRLNADHIEVEYEDLSNDTESILNKIAKYIGLDTIGSWDTSLKKVTPHKMKQALSNYNEVRNRMVREGFERFLHD